MSKEGDLLHPDADLVSSAELLDVLADYPRLLAVYLRNSSKEEFLQVEDQIIDVLASLSEEQWQLCLESFLADRS